MNIKKVYYNAPAPLFVMTLDASTRKEGFESILCYAAAIQHDVGDAELPQNAVNRGHDLLEQYGKGRNFGIESAKFSDFWNNYHDDEERILLLAYLALTSIIRSKPYDHVTNRQLLSRMSGHFKNVEQYHPKVAEYNSIYKMRKLKKLLTKYYKVSFFNESRGFFASLTLSEEQLAKQLGKKDGGNNTSVKPSVDYQAIIAQKDAQIEQLQCRIADLEAQLAQTKSKAVERKIFSQEVNNQAKKIFTDFYNSKVPGCSYYWEAKDSGQMTNLLKQLKHSLDSAELPCTDERLIDKLKEFLKSISDNWTLSHLSVSTISSRYNEIIASNSLKKKKNASDFVNVGDNSGAYDKENTAGFDFL